MCTAACPEHVRHDCRQSRDCPLHQREGYASIDTEPMSREETLSLFEWLLIGVCAITFLFILSGAFFAGWMA